MNTIFVALVSQLFYLKMNFKLQFDVVIISNAFLNLSVSTMCQVADRNGFNYYIYRLTAGISMCPRIGDIYVSLYKTAGSSAISYHFLILFERNFNGFQRCRKNS